MQPQNSNLMFGGGEGQYQHQKLHEQPAYPSTASLSVTEHLYQATLARNKAKEAQILQAKLANEIKEMQECTFKPVMATAGNNNFSH